MKGSTEWAPTVPIKNTSAASAVRSHHRHYLERSPQYYLQKAKESSDELYQLLELVFQQDRHPEQLYRSCDGLMRLQRNSDAAAFSKACQMAIEYQNYSYGFVRNLLGNKMVELQLESAKEQALPPHQNIRGKEYFKQV